jgi:hypothetical protein
MGYPAVGDRAHRDLLGAVGMAFEVYRCATPAKAASFDRPKSAAAHWPTSVSA